MTAFLKIDDCKTCLRSLPWEWVPAVLLNGKSLPGTGVWRSQLIDRQCATCLANVERQRENHQRTLAQRVALLHLLGGDKPYREFTFERYEVIRENQLAFDVCRDFNPATENLYLWGPCGVGKTHLAWAIARKCFEETLSVAIVHAAQLSRKVRMKDPEQEQGAIDELIHVDALVLDDLAAGSDTPYSRQILQEILDGRNYQERGGLVITSPYSLDTLAARLLTDSISSRLSGLCRVIEIGGRDRRLPKGRQAF